MAFGVASGWVTDQRQSKKNSDAAENSPVTSVLSGAPALATTLIHAWYKGVLTVYVVPDNQSLARRSGTPGMLRWGLLGASGCVLEGVWKDRCLQEGCTGFSATRLVPPQILGFGACILLGCES